MRTRFNRWCVPFVLAGGAAGLAWPVCALDGGDFKMDTYNGWIGFEVITAGDNPAGDGVGYAMPGYFDGLGAQISGTSIRVQVNHEISSGNATISEVLLDRDNFLTAIGNAISNGNGINNTGGVGFVTSAQQSYNRWSSNNGSNWSATSDASSTAFNRFCSGQSYLPNTFGVGRGFVDNVYITGEEVGGGRLFALDIDQADLYQVSGVAGSGGSGLGGMPFDAWENAALVDTGETDHVAMLLSPDGGTQNMTMYIGEKGRDAAGGVANDFLSRNGLAYGSYYYLNDTLPASAGSTSTDGFFDTTASGALNSSKLEDVDTSPTQPNRVALGDQNSGVFTFEFDLDFSGGSFDAGASGFELSKIANDLSGTTELGSADNLDWTAATTLNANAYPEGLIFVNEDNSSGQVWVMEPDGTGKTLIASTVLTTESSGVLDISTLLGYEPGSIVLTDNQTNSDASLSVLINPDATLAPVFGDFDLDGDIDNADIGFALGNFTGPGLSDSMTPELGDSDGDGDIDQADIDTLVGLFTGALPPAPVPASVSAAVPEPTSLALLSAGVLLVTRRRRRDRFAR